MAIASPWVDPVSKPGDVNVQHCGLAVIKCGEAAVDRCGEIVGLGDAFAMRRRRGR